MDLIKKKEERAKLLRFNNLSAVDALNAAKEKDKTPAQPVQAIEMASTAKQEAQPKDVIDRTGPPKTLEAILAKRRTAGGLLGTSNLDSQKEPLLAPRTQQQVSGVKKMQFGIFRKAKAFEDSDEEAEKQKAANEI